MDCCLKYCPQKCRKVHKVFLLQFNIAPTPYNACYLFMVKLSVPTILSSSVSFLFGFQLKLWCLSGISYHVSLTGDQGPQRTVLIMIWADLADILQLTTRMFQQSILGNNLVVLFTNNSLDNICQSNLIIISNPPFSGNRLEVSMKVWLH